MTVKRVTSISVRDCTCGRCEGNIGEKVEQDEEL